MIEAQLQGRRLILTVSGEEGDPAIEPFVISPLPARVGRELSADYLNMILRLGNVTAERKREIFEIALDGVDPETGQLPHDSVSGEKLLPLTDRVAAELTQEEGELITLAAFMWHTIVGLDGVRMFLESANREGSTAAAGKAVRLLTQRLALLPSPTSPNSELGSLIPSPAATPRTSTRPAGAANGSALARLPRGKRSIRQRAS